MGSSPIRQSERFLSSHVAGGHRRRTAEVCTVMGKKKKPARRSERPWGEPLLIGVTGRQSSQSVRRVWGHRSLVDTMVLERAGAVHQGLPIS